MKYLHFLLLFLFLNSLLISQVEYKDQLIENSIYSNAPDEIKTTKPFVRQWAFWEERAYPDGEIPPNAYLNAYNEKEQLKNNGFSNNAITWVSLGPTPGAYFNYGNISSRIVTGAYHPFDPSIIYIGAANGGVWKSVDNGQNWSPLTDNQPSLSMGAIAIDYENPDIIYAGTGEATYSGSSYYGAGLLKSTDAGNSWMHLTSGLPVRSYFSRIRISPRDNEMLLAAIGYNGLVKSTDGGNSWHTIFGGRVDDVIFSPSGDTVFAVGSGIGLKRSIDGGNSFSDFGSGLASGNRTHFDLCKSNPAIMVAAVYSSGDVNVYKSTNYGKNWNQVVPGYDFNGGQAWYDLYIRISPNDPKNIFVGTIDVYRSTNGGTSFTNITDGYNGGSVHVDQHYLFFHPDNNNTFIVCNDGGIYRSTNNGNDFENLNTNLTLTQFYRIKASPFNPGRILGGTQDNGTQQTFSTLDWAAAFGGDGGEVSFNPFDDSFIIGETQNGYLVRTVNGGSSWIYGSMNGIDQSESVAWVAPIEVHPSEANVFFVARQKLYKTTSNGGSWTAVSSDISGSNAIRELAVSETNPDIIYASSGNRLYVTTDAGANWSFVSGSLPNLTITSVYVHPENDRIAFVTLSGFSSGSKVYKTEDYGVNWRNISGNLPNSPANDIFVYTEDQANPNTYFVATDIGVFLTHDDGLTYEELDNGLPNTVIIHLDYSPSTKMMRAGTHGRGVYEAFIDFAVPVELESFTSHVIDNSVYLSWKTATETNNRVFEIERKLKNQSWQRIGYRNGKGTTTKPQSYSFSDDLSGFNYTGTVLYRLKQIDYNGSFEYSKIINAEVSNIPERITLYQNYPNPFNPVTTIKYALTNESKVNLTVYNSLGEEVANLVNNTKNAGTHFVKWNAENFTSGVYFYSLKVEDKITGEVFNQMKKILLVK